MLYYTYALLSTRVLRGPVSPPLLNPNRRCRTSPLHHNGDRQGIDPPTDWDERGFLRSISKTPRSLVRLRQTSTNCHLCQGSVSVIHANHRSMLLFSAVRPRGKPRLAFLETVFSTREAIPSVRIHTQRDNLAPKSRRHSLYPQSPNTVNVCSPEITYVNRCLAAARNFNVVIDEPELPSKPRNQEFSVPRRSRGGLHKIYPWKKPPSRCCSVPLVASFLC